MPEMTIRRLGILSVARVYGLILNAGYGPPTAEQWAVKLARAIESRKVN